MAAFTDQLQRAEQRIQDTTDVARDELQQAAELLNQAAENIQVPAAMPPSSPAGAANNEPHVHMQRHYTTNYH
jgi:hypothetical protein